jgi:hypothetical protein
MKKIDIENENFVAVKVAISAAMSAAACYTRGPDSRPSQTYD